MIDIQRVNVGPAKKDGSPHPCQVCKTTIYRPLTWDEGKTFHWVCAACLRKANDG